MRTKFLEPALEISDAIRKILPFFEEVDVSIQDLKNTLGKKDPYREFLNLKSVLYNEIIVPVRKLERKIQRYNDLEKLGKKMRFEQIIESSLKIIESEEDAISLEEALKLEDNVNVLKKELKKLI